MGRWVRVDFVFQAAYLGQVLQLGFGLVQTHFVRFQVAFLPLRRLRLAPISG